MCEQLTSCALKVTEPYAVLCHTTNNHSATWAALKLEIAGAVRGRRACHRELEWIEGQEGPCVRWQMHDSEESRALIIEWLQHKFPKRLDLIDFNVARAVYVYANGATGLTKLECPKAKIVQ